MRRSRYFIPFLLLFLGMSGCAGIGVDSKGNNIEEEKIKKIVPGVTTRDDIIKIFGKPASAVKKKGNLEELYYEYEEKRTPLYLGGFFIYEKGTKEKMVTLNIVIKDDVVESYFFEMKEDK